MTGQVVALGCATRRIETPLQKGSVLEEERLSRTLVADSKFGRNSIAPMVRSVAGLKSELAFGTVNSPQRRKPEKAAQQAA